MNYRVQRGDCLWTIAQRHHVSLAALERANPQIKNPSLIFAGQTVHLPGSADTFEPAKTHARPPPHDPARRAPASTTHVAGKLPHSSSAFINSVARGAGGVDSTHGFPDSIGRRGVGGGGSGNGWGGSGGNLWGGGGASGGGS